MSATSPVILIVDDVKENRTALERALLDENPTWRIVLADGDASAVQVLEKYFKGRDPVDVVLTDLVMQSEQDGMNVLEQARRVDPLVMAILFTAKERNLDRYKALEVGAFDVVEKNIRGSLASREINLKTRAALRYREWSQRINFLRRYFDPAVFSRIERDPAALALRERLVTIVFWDIRGFSLLCESLKAEPALISDFLAEYFEVGARTVFENSGLLDKFIGDGVMALFGVLNGKSDDGKSDALAAMRAATDFRHRFDELRRRWVTQWEKFTPQKIDVGLGCGIHTGSALVGNVGSPTRDQFTALGPNVNLCSRIEARAGSGQILVTQTTESRVRGDVKLSPAGEIQDVKNIPGVFRLFSVV